MFLLNVNNIFLENSNLNDLGTLLEINHQNTTENIQKAE